MSAKLYYVEATLEYYAMADSEQDARDLISHAVRDWDAPADDAYPREVTSNDHPIAPGWDDGLPYGRDPKGDRTVDQIIRDTFGPRPTAADREAARLQIPLLAEPPE